MLVTDPAWNGLPLDAERDGHWLLELKGSGGYQIVGTWKASARLWTNVGRLAIRTAADVASTWTLIGPVALVAPSAFTPEEYTYLAALLRNYINKDRSAFQAVLSNNINVILGALDACAGTAPQPLTEAGFNARLAADIARNPEIEAGLRAKYEAWFAAGARAGIEMVNAKAKAVAVDLLERRDNYPAGSSASFRYEFAASWVRHVINAAITLPPCPAALPKKGVD